MDYHLLIANVKVTDGDIQTYTGGYLIELFLGDLSRHYQTCKRPAKFSNERGGVFMGEGKTITS
jgi:hypothetical protein